jgi:hypothetical protein
MQVWAYIKIEVHGGEVCSSGLINYIVRSLADVGLVRDNVSQQWSKRYGKYMTVCSLRVPYEIGTRSFHPRFIGPMSVIHGFFEVVRI